MRPRRESNAGVAPQEPAAAEGREGRPPAPRERADARDGGSENDGDSRVLVREQDGRQSGATRPKNPVLYIESMAAKPHPLGW